VIGFGSDAWDPLFGLPRPVELHPFREISAGSRHAVSTPGDILFHIRAKRMDLCFELATQIMARLGNAVSPVDEVHGFRYFDNRDLVGFVDGTENPREQAAIEATIIGDEDSAFVGGSYVANLPYSPALLQGKSFRQILDEVNSTNPGQIGQAVDAEADGITAIICKTDGAQPPSV